MPVPDTNGVAPFADFEDLKRKINEIVQKYNNLLVNLDSLNVVSLTADNIDAGTINADLVTIRSDLDAGAYIQIDGNGMVINDGSKNTFTADIQGHVTMTGATIQSADGTYPRIVMNPDTNLFGAYRAANNYIEMNPNVTAVQLDFVNGLVSGFIQAFNVLDSYLLIGSSSDIRLAPTGDVRVPSWARLLNETSSRTLQQDLDSLSSSITSLSSSVSALSSALSGKATAGASTDSAGPFNGGIPIGTELAVNGGGFVTWAGITAHSHTQT